MAFFGPAGTFTEEAASRLNGELVAFDSIIEVLEAVKTDRAKKGVVPIENSIEGPVGVTLDLLAQDYDLIIEKEIILPISHNLMVNKGVKLDEIDSVYSHAQPLAQCRIFLEKLGLITHSTSSTAAAAKFIKGKNNAAAIGNHRAAELYDLDIIQTDIQDFENNRTRFIVLGNKESQPTDNDKTSIVFSLYEDRPGGLYGILGYFASENINLTKIESRPSKKGLGKYIFFIDFEGHIQDKVVKDILDTIKENTPFLKLLGSYSHEN
ncbi:MAG: prephenate dehydratase [Methanobacteriaceae archaeon]|nr:prephenate dehydratase [Methanobacteriaceae archaeon]MDP2836698.1 prephenate dehydratase [Methanobacteriaceae archaeon]MDP3034090.1 prephenate dehydratase [Methanobacteriaceae archaeon]MDP3623606.1 prephenate dehydratase [Methanobacteriaceae archaeon]